jgi:hypothetical protein
VDELMTELAGCATGRRDRSLIEPLTDNHRTLREHYRRRVYLSESGQQRYDSWLKRVFPLAKSSTGYSAERLLTDLKPLLIRAMLRHSRVHPYTVFQVLRALRRRARELDLKFSGSKRDMTQRVTHLHERILADFLRRNEETYFL